jgi:hypothetical protein
MATWLKALFDYSARLWWRLRYGKPSHTYYMGEPIWGDTIRWFPNSGHIVGWVVRLPQRGDYMVSGSISYVITNVRHCRDPEDMFFADVHPVPSYVDQAPPTRISLGARLAYTGALTQQSDKKLTFR